jgi:UTP--glucose-1-phosphate uridylyltransferase
MAIELAIIPVAGHGTRLLPLTKSQPKEMLPAGRKPAAQHVVEELARSGVRRVVFVTSAGKESIQDHFDSDAGLIALLRRGGKEELLEELRFERLGLEYCHIRQSRQLGLGHAVLCARPFVQDQAFVVALGDTIIGLHPQPGVVTRMAEQFEKARADAVIAFDEVPPHEVSQHGIAQPRVKAGPVFELADIVEKPGAAEAPSNLAVAARYVFSPEIFTLLAATPPGKGGEIQLTDAIRALIHKGGKVLGVRLGPGEGRFDIGNFESYFQVFCEFALADPRYGPGLRAYLRRVLEPQPLSPPERQDAKEQ